MPNRAKIWLIFISGIIFYGFWRIEFVPVMLFTAFVDYYIALHIDKIPVENKTKRKQWLLLSIIVNFGLLMYFKYLLFFTENANSLFNFIGVDFSLPIYSIILPLGISFYTFESVCYTVDVYRGHLKPSRDWVLYGGFITFFPKLIAGPILRASEILHQLKERPKLQLSYIGDGISRILIGLFLKVVIADNISVLVDEGFNLDITQMSAIDVFTLAFLFGFQIYFDFAGYSHIAIGCGRLMGIDISENFNFPYMAKSFKEFWKRWHISLSSWIRDYLYLPLSGKKVVNRIGSTGNILIDDKTVSEGRKDAALFLTWMIMGFWHGANWTFVLWGLLHACFIFGERQLLFIRVKFFKNYPSFLGWGVTLILSMLAWIPFRAVNLTATFGMYKKLFFIDQYQHLGMKENTYIVTFVLLMFIIMTYLSEKYLLPKLLKLKIPYFIFSTIKYTVLIILVFTFLRPISQFIYFQF